MDYVLQDDGSYLFNAPRVDNNHPLLACKDPQFDEVAFTVKSGAMGPDGVSSTITKDKPYRAFCFKHNQGVMTQKKLNFQIVFKALM